MQRAFEFIFKGSPAFIGGVVKPRPLYSPHLKIHKRDFIVAFMEKPGRNFVFIETAFIFSSLLLFYPDHEQIFNPFSDFAGHVFV